MLPIFRTYRLHTNSLHALLELMTPVCLHTEHEKTAAHFSYAYVSENFKTTCSPFSEMSAKELPRQLSLGERSAEDRVVAGSNPALGTFKPILSLFQQISLKSSINSSTYSRNCNEAFTIYARGRLTNWCSLFGGQNKTSFRFHVIIRVLRGIVKCL